MSLMEIIINTYTWKLWSWWMEVQIFIILVVFRVFMWEMHMYCLIFSADSPLLKRFYCICVQVIQCLFPIDMDRTKMSCVISSFHAIIMFFDCLTFHQSLRPTYSKLLCTYFWYDVETLGNDFIIFKCILNSVIYV